MRLINTRTYEFEEFEGDQIPEYAILSHRWQEEEVLYKDMINGTAKGKKGYRKIEKLCELAGKIGLSHAWCDTCCIDKSSSAELSEAINSMFNWYKRSSVCYAYLFDVQCQSDVHLDSTSTLEQRTFLQQFHNSQWFRRSWTLQELLAPRTLLFLNHSWTRIGSKHQLCGAVTYATGIPGFALARDFEPGVFTVAEKMSWAAKRAATRIEDTAYSLWGLFGVNLPLLYGEGTTAFRRLQEEILRQTEDDSFLLHTSRSSGAFADSPSDFSCYLTGFNNEQGYPSKLSQSIHLPGQLLRYISEPEPLSVSHAGLHIQRPLLQWCDNVYLVSLKTIKRLNNTAYQAYIFVSYSDSTKRLERLYWEHEAVKFLPLDPEIFKQEDLLSRKLVSFGHRQIIARYPHGRNREFGKIVDQCSVEMAFVQRHKNVLASDQTLTPPRPKDVLARLCWLTDDETIAVAGTSRIGTESHAVLRMIRGCDTYYLHIGLNPQGIPCMVYVPELFFDTPSDVNCFERLLERPFDRTRGGVSLTGILKQSCHRARHFRPAGALLDDYTHCATAADNTTFTIGIPEFEIETHLEGQRCTFVLHNLSAESCSFRADAKPKSVEPLATNPKIASESGSFKRIKRHLEILARPPDLRRVK